MTVDYSMNNGQMLNQVITASRHSRKIRLKMNYLIALDVAFFILFCVSPLINWTLKVMIDVAHMSI